MTGFLYKIDGRSFSLCKIKKWLLHLGHGFVHAQWLHFKRHSKPLEVTTSSRRRLTHTVLVQPVYANLRVASKRHSSSKIRFETTAVRKRDTSPPRKSSSRLLCKRSTLARKPISRPLYSTKGRPFIANFFYRSHQNQNQNQRCWQSREIRDRWKTGWCIIRATKSIPPPRVFNFYNHLRCLFLGLTHCSPTCCHRTRAFNGIVRR